jgi:patatin-related protein
MVGQGAQTRCGRMAGDLKQLRLGLVCYGGSSLCIYMHGITKELHRLVRASSLRAHGAAATGASELVYQQLLDRLQQERADGLDLRVVVDVIAGTSAGGINGIFLAKALAGNLSQDSLRRLWFDRGDMNELVIGPRKLLGIRLTWKKKLPLLLWKALRRSPLRGDDMSRWLYNALEQMDRDGTTGAAGTSLMPQGSPLDLFVTITDFYGYQRLIQIARPKFVPDARHRHALSFHSPTSGPDQFADNAGLAFAARTTSCFPAVFPPVSLGGFSKAIGAPLTKLSARCFRIYQLSDTAATNTYFVDGGVLDNKPFGWAIDTLIHRRPAETEVDRRLLYIEPDPGQGARVQGGTDPETLQAALGALTTIPRSEPILDDLLDVDAHNERVAEIRDVIETNFRRVAQLVEQLVPLESIVAQPPSQWPWATWSRDVNQCTTANAGLGYATYMRLKISKVLEGFAHSICLICNYPDEYPDQSNHARLVRQALRAWAERRGLFEGLGREPEGDPCTDSDSPYRDPKRPIEPSEAQLAFLRAFDLGFMRRRLRFVVAAFNWWYRCVDQEGFPTREELDQCKATAWQAITQLDALAQLRVTDQDSPDAQAQAAALRQQVQDTFPEQALRDFLNSQGAKGELYAAEHATQLDALFAASETFLNSQLVDFAPTLLAQFAHLTQNWKPRRQRDLVVRYLGFPLWDVLIYPIQSLSQVGEQDEIEVIRLSPHEANVLEPPSSGKVQGVRQHHFYAFFSREARENDYLWGRLDAAEQLIQLLLDSSGSSESLKHWCKESFTAILEEEADALATIADTVSEIRGQVIALSPE